MRDFRKVLNKKLTEKYGFSPKNARVVTTIILEAMEDCIINSKELSLDKIGKFVHRRNKKSPVRFMISNYIRTLLNKRMEKEDATKKRILKQSNQPEHQD